MEKKIKLFASDFGDNESMGVYMQICVAHFTVGHLLHMILQWICAIYIAFHKVL